MGSLRWIKPCFEEYRAPTVAGKPAPAVASQGSTVPSDRLAAFGCFADDAGCFAEPGSFNCGRRLPTPAI